jgi:hypothetical protein
MNYKFYLFYLVCHIVTLLNLTASAQADRWQQRIGYNINVTVDVIANQFLGTEKIEYWNNSPDTLHRLFFHLYWNAFQPGSMMDVRSRDLGKTVLFQRKNGDSVLDWDGRVKDRISRLLPDEIGYQRVSSVLINGMEQELKEHETILEVRLTKPIFPKSKTSLEVKFTAQVPLQIRRSGRDNAEGVRFSMSQWYPKMVEYDYQGWNANPYVAREFYGVWGDFEVHINIDKSYLVAGTGTLQNPQEIGMGYQQEGTTVKDTRNALKHWHFKAKNVHDFVWAADPEFVLLKEQVSEGPLLYVVFKDKPGQRKAWEELLSTMVRCYPFISENFGSYPYKNYSFIQGGDGGMEYPMATLIKTASTGTAIHEWMHSWFQGVLGTNESLYAWMDEGFTTYAESLVSSWLKGEGGFPFNDDYEGYFALRKSGREEPMSTHADHYNTNYAYSLNAYSKGSVFLSQLGYIVGNKNLKEILLQYFNIWAFKHPNPNDFIRLAEMKTGIQLQWYKEYWVNSTKAIDYSLSDITDESGRAKILLNRLQPMPMPIDLLITYKDGSQTMYYIPMNLMYGAKPAESDVTRVILPDWKWVNTEYSFVIDRPVSQIKVIEIDPSRAMADINRVNNKVVVPDSN